MLEEYTKPYFGQHMLKKYTVDAELVGHAHKPDL